MWDIVLLHTLNRMDRLMSEGHSPNGTQGLDTSNEISGRFDLHPRCGRRDRIHFLCAAINSQLAERAARAHEVLRRAGHIEKTHRRRANELHLRMPEPVVQSTSEQSAPQRSCPKELRFQLSQGAISVCSGVERKSAGRRAVPSVTAWWSARVQGSALTTCGAAPRSMLSG
jgi:hypothetical protein